MKSSFQAVALLCNLPQEALGHGSMNHPPSRGYKCTRDEENNHTEGCASLKGTHAYWEPQSIGIQEVDGKKANIPDGKLCSAGITGFEKMDTTAANLFNATTLEPDVGSGGKEFTMNYWYTTPHMTRFHRVFMTKPSWDYQTATNLSWADLEEEHFCEWDSMTHNTNISPESWKCPFPDRPKGSRVMFVGLWQRSDSLEAFMSCSDVEIGGSEQGGEEADQKPPQAAVPSPKGN